MQLVNSCKSYRNQADGFYAADAWTDISEKLKINFTASLGDGALIHCIMCSWIKKNLKKNQKKHHQQKNT